MHGILVRPLFAWPISRISRDERFQLRAVWTVIALYAAVVVGAVITSVFNTRWRQEALNGLAWRQTLA